MARATRPGFTIIDGKVRGKNVSFDWAGGFALTQKQKNVTSLHEALGGRALEVSTRSKVALGVKLSAFNLKVDGYPLENVFQAGKVFEHGGPYTDLLEVSPRDAKRDPRIKGGKLVAFQYKDEKWALDPKSAFYDYLYINAVRACISKEELEMLEKYQYFTDIEFNPKKSLNTQARAIALVKLMMHEYGEIPQMTKEEFLRFHNCVVVY